MQNTGSNRKVMEVQQMKKIIATLLFIATNSVQAACSLDSFCGMKNEVLATSKFYNVSQIGIFDLYYWTGSNSVMSDLYKNADEVDRLFRFSPEKGRAYKNVLSMVDSELSSLGYKKRKKGQLGGYFTLSPKVRVVETLDIRESSKFEVTVRAEITETVLTLRGRVTSGYITDYYADTVTVSKKSELESAIYDSLEHLLGKIKKDVVIARKYCESMECKVIEAIK